MGKSTKYFKTKDKLFKECKIMKLIDENAFIFNFKINYLINSKIILDKIKLSSIFLQFLFTFYFQISKSLQFILQIH